MGLKQAIDITCTQRKILVSLLSQHLPNTDAWIYRSRVSGTSRPQSDLDIVVFLSPQQSQDVSILREAFEDSNLPFRVDLFVWDDIPENFRAQIKENMSQFRGGITHSEIRQ